MNQQRARPTGPTFEEFVEEHGQRLFRLGLLVTGDRADAEDAVQEALLRAFHRWDRVGTARDPHAYLRRMVLNQSVSDWRRTRRREIPVAEVTPPAAGHGDPAESAEDAGLWSACRALPAKLRAAVVLRFYEDLSYPEIAEALGCREAAARARVSRGLARIRTRLEEEGR